MKISRVLLVVTPGLYISSQAKSYPWIGRKMLKISHKINKVKHRGDRKMKMSMSIAQLFIGASQEADAVATNTAQTFL